MKKVNVEVKRLYQGVKMPVEENGRCTIGVYYSKELNLSSEPRVTARAILPNQEIEFDTGLEFEIYKENIELHLGINDFMPKYKGLVVTNIDENKLTVKNITKETIMINRDEPLFFAFFVKVLKPVFKEVVDE